MPLYLFKGWSITIFPIVNFNEIQYLFLSLCDHVMIIPNGTENKPKSYPHHKLMSIPEQHFKDSDDVIEWHKTRVPGSHERYLEIRKRIKDSGFSGSAKLLKNVDSDKSVTGRSE